MRYRIHMLQHGSFNNNIYFIHFINKMAMKYVKTLFREKKITFNTYFVNYKDYRSERDWWRILKRTCIEKWVCPIYNIWQTIEGRELRVFFSETGFKMSLKCTFIHSNVKIHFPKVLESKYEYFLNIKLHA